MENKVITVTSPLLPSLDDFIPYLQDIWNRKWLTNNGHYHQELEKALCEYLKVPYISLFTNGTLPLMCALQALRITGEVITTPYSFVATTHALWWNGIKPVFVDIDPETCNIDPDKIEAAITPKTTAIMPVHVYGKPCDTERIQAIADKYGLKVIYDAAHAFGVEVGGKSILNAGDMSTLSFHATKVYNTIEGGALICHDEKTKKRIDYLKNFGFAGETTVIAPGINGKMDEVRSAYGLLNLKQVDAAIEARRQVAIMYRKLYYDVQKLYSLEYSDGKSRISLDHAVEQLDLDQERPFHRALDDAVYTGRTLRHINMEEYGKYSSIDYYRLPKRGCSYQLKFPEYSKYVSGEFDCKEEILKDKEIADIVCVKCARMLRKKIRWFSYGQRFYFALGICPEHGYMKGKIRVKKSERDLYYAVKTIKAVGEDALPMLVQKREDNKKKKKNPSK